ncbi:unnamed protein product [Phytophthora fragariaefolia]|uniref:Unnamed protein product n=1 Tax=Phytophthora fragariaefolia TaxID=1490495 RepID=A0A9W6XJI3_9STRA|nr:unnamed protein product [Phytophthora fragariaefolia]
MLRSYMREIDFFEASGQANPRLESDDKVQRDKWTRATKAFVVLKDKIVNAPILTHFYPDKRPVVILYASKWAISAALVQEHEGVYKPVTFTSRMLKPTEINYGIVDKEQVTSQIDIDDLTTLNRLAELLVPQSQISVVKIAATTRSRQRRGWDELQEPLVQRMRMEWIGRAQDEVKGIVDLKKYMTGDVRELTSTEAKACTKIAEDYEIVEAELLFYCPPSKPSFEDRDLGTRLVIPETLQEDVLHHYHSSLEGGHQGIGRTYQRIRTHFHWRGLYRSVQQYVGQCVDCETGKGRPTTEGDSPATYDNGIPTPSQRYSRTYGSNIDSVRQNVCVGYQPTGLGRICGTTDVRSKYGSRSSARGYALYLMHGWDPRTTLETMIPLGSTRRRDREPRRWRYDVQRHYQQARTTVNERLRGAIQSRADRHNESIRPYENNVDRHRFAETHERRLDAVETKERLPWRENIEEAKIFVLLVVVCAAAIVGSSTRLRADNENVLTVTKLDFNFLLASRRYNGWFRGNLRCSQRNFVRICELFRSHALASLTRGHEHSYEKKMGLLMMYLASSGSMGDAGLALGISKPYAPFVINELLRVICMQAKAYIKMHSSDAEWRDVMSGFYAVRGFPYVCGAVDGSLFEIARPAEYEGWHCKDFYPAIKMQAICDSRRRFMDYDMRPGSYSDKQNWNV